MSLADTSKRSVPSMEEPGQLLTVIVDANHDSWEALAKNLPNLPSNVVWSSAHRNSVFATMVDHLFVFLNAFLLLNRSNKLCVIATTADDNVTLYPATNKPLEALKPTTHDSVESQVILDRFGYAASRVKTSLLDLVSRPTVTSANDARKPPLPTPTPTTPSTSSSSSSSSTTASIPSTPAIPSSSSPTTQTHTSLLAGALTKALLYITRAHREDKSLVPRVLVVSASSDNPTFYLPVMNSIFFAQKCSIPIDCLFLSNTPSATSPHLHNPSTSTTSASASSPTSTSLYLQQASHLTQGFFHTAVVAMQPSDSTTNATNTAAAATTTSGTGAGAASSGGSGTGLKLTFTVNSRVVSGSTAPAGVMPLSTTLITLYLASPLVRMYLHTPRLTSVDLRAACVCHHNNISNGYVCPVCLAVYCKPDRLLCTVCNSRFTKSRLITRRPAPGASPTPTPRANVGATPAATPRPTTGVSGGVTRPSTEAESANKRLKTE